MATIHFDTCPICKGKNLSFYQKTKDWGFSGDSFDIVKCTDCTFALTQDAPDQESIAKYYHHDDYVSHTDTKEGVFFKVYHFIRNIMLNKKRKWVEKHAKKGNVLDIGAGTGYFLNNLKTENWNVEGFEPEEAARKVAKKNFDIDLSSDFETLINGEKKYDAISMWHVLEHVHTLNEYFEYFKKMMAVDAKVFIAVPNYTSKDALFYKENWAAWDVPKHLWHFSPKSLKTLAEKHGFEVEKMYGLPYDSYYISLLSEKGFLGKLRAVFVGEYSYLTSLMNVEKASSVLYVLKLKK